MDSSVPPDAKVLFTQPVPASEAGAWAARVKEGSLTILGGGTAALSELRRRYSEWENIMVSPGDRSDIPWADGRFSLIVDIHADQPTQEMRRALSDGGSIVGFEDLANAL